MITICKAVVALLEALSSHAALAADPRTVNIGMHGTLTVIPNP